MHLLGGSQYCARLIFCFLPLHFGDGVGDDAGPDVEVGLSRLHHGGADGDGELALADIIPSFLNILKQFAPHGPENMKPIFLSRGVSDFQKQTELVKEKHIRFQVTQDGQTVFPGIGFNMGERMPWLREQDQFDILYHIEENVWKDKRSIQLKILDIR